MGYRRGYYRKDGTYVQGHFTNTTQKRSTKGKYTKKGCLGSFLVAGLLLLIFSCSSDDGGCREQRCSDFMSQTEAQQAFEADRQCNENLDADNDGIACENLAN